MKSYVKYLGIVDKTNKNHYVEFTSGVNVITGKSSTGKSAIVEIFDYCFGSKEFTIPSGIITDNADIYFMVLSVNDSFLVIGRIPHKPKIFLNYEGELPDINNLNKEYFKSDYYTSDFNIEMGHYLGLNISDTDEDEKIKEYRGRKKGRPSIRSIVPFLLQHQNLIANKHSLFYRFDQKEKREQTIEQFKIFSGFVTQEYFILKQQLANAERELKTLENQQKTFYEQRDFNVFRFNSLLNDYEAVTGEKLTDKSAKFLLLNPANTLDYFENKEIITNYESEKSLNELKALRVKRNKLYSEKRIFINKLNDISSSIEYAKTYFLDIGEITNEHEETIRVSECPFCNSHSEKISSEANHLEGAINWLNNELKKSNYLLDSFESDKKELEDQLKLLNNDIDIVYKEIIKLEEITRGLDKNKDLEVQALKIKLKIENLLESLIGKDISELEQKIEKTKSDIKNYKKNLFEKFNVDEKIKNAEKYINEEMQKIGKKFDFEEAYKPINLKFSLSSFDLWHEKADGEKTYLRSMGSGANWLYSHLTLFLAINKFFCSLGKQAIVPPILFLDQPSQVYFPTSIKDENEKFDVHDIEAKKGTNTGDEDLDAVTNLFNQLVSFTQKTFNETSIEPQIIILDHADHLKLDNNVEFENLVAGRRWRSRGFIN